MKTNVNEEVQAFIERAVNRSVKIRDEKVLTSDYLLATIIESEKNKLGKYLMQNGYFDKGDNFYGDLLEDYCLEKEFIETINPRKKRKKEIVYSKEVREVMKEAERLAEELKLEKVNLDCIIFVLMGRKNEIWSRIFPIPEITVDDCILRISIFPLEMLDVFSKERLENGTFGDLNKKIKIQT